MKSNARFQRRANALVRLALIAAAIYLISQGLAGASAVRPVSYSEFINGVREGKVASVQIGATEFARLAPA